MRPAHETAIIYCFDEFCEVHHKHMHAWDLLMSTICCVFRWFTKDHRKKQCYMYAGKRLRSTIHCTLLKSAIKTRKLGTSLKSTIYRSFWCVVKNPYRLPYSWQRASLMLGILERSSAKHAEEISPNPYRFPHTSKRISLMPRIFECKPVSLPMQFKR